jgi:SRSO17 transposase
MGRGKSEKNGARFSAYVEGLVGVVGHADRAGPLRDYCMGLILPGERKSVEPMAARTAPARTAAQHQSLLHFVGQAPWSDEAMLAKVRQMVLPEIERHGAIEAWIIDDTGFPKKGKHSVGVGRQYCGQLGKQDNCQVAVSLSLANHHGSLPVAYRLYLPQDWCEDGERRAIAGVPKDIAFKTKPEIALEQIRWALEAGLPRGVIIFDPGYGNDAGLRLSITTLGLNYIAGIQSNCLVWPAGKEPGGDEAPKRGRRFQPDLISVKEMALGLPRHAWRTLKWREGTAGALKSRFARVRVCSGHKHRIKGGRYEEWLVIEWPEDEAEPTKYWLSTLPRDIGFAELVDLAKLRWRIERDYQELKQEVGLGHFEGRSWRGFHHHATLCIAAYGFLISERETIPPSDARLATAAISKSARSRKATAAHRTPYSKFHCHHAATPDRRARQTAAPMTLLRGRAGRNRARQFMTQ